MARVNGHHLVGGLHIAPLGAVGQGAPDEGDRRQPHKSLSQGGHAHLVRQIVRAAQESEGMAEGQIAPQARFKHLAIRSPDWPGQRQIAFKGVPVAGGGHCAQHPLPLDAAHPLGGPEEEGQLLGAKRLRRVFAPA